MAGKPEDSPWISKRAASRMLGIGRRALDQMIDEGKFTVRAVPGTWLRLLRAEVEAIASACTVEGSL